LEININVELFTKYIYFIQEDFVLLNELLGTVKKTHVLFTAIMLQRDCRIQYGFKEWIPIQKKALPVNFPATGVFR